MGRVIRRQYINVPNNYWECSHNVIYIIEENNA